MSWALTAGLLALALGLVSRALFRRAGDGITLGALGAGLLALIALLSALALWGSP